MGKLFHSLKEKTKSIRIRLFLILCVVVVLIILFLILINNVVLESFYLYAKQNTLKGVYEKINNYYNHPSIEIDISRELEKIAVNNNFDILIKTDRNINVYTSDKDFLSTINEMNALTNTDEIPEENVLYVKDNVMIRKLEDQESGLTYILLSAKLDNDYLLYIRIPVASITESVKISNKFLILMGGFTVFVSAIIASFISRRFTEPILELNDIATSMSKLNFSKKYRVKDTDDEINNLGRSINIMSDKLESTISQLKKNNMELERDVEEKSKIDEMRKQFISDVSHELKTPIALIQGYAEGLVENVNSDEESRKFYAEVILDESNKMDLLVKQLLELMKLEYEKREFNNKVFDVTELLREVIRKSKVMLEEDNITVELNGLKPAMVYADSFYIEQVVTNYFTNAIKHAEEVNKEKKIVIDVQKNEENNKIRVSVFNTGKNIDEENLNRIWKRFYKVDSSRNRAKGGTGIGLSLVKAIMNNYENDYGVTNKENGVEFYFELDVAKGSEEEEEEEG